MKIKLFGKTLFESSKGGDLLLLQANNENKDSKFLPDFYRETGSSSFEYSFLQLSEGSALAIPTKKGAKAKKKVVKPKDEPIRLTPKGVYECKLLHDQSFKLNTDPAYVDKQLSDFKEKLSLIKSAEYDMRRGVNEIASITARLENRKRYAEVKDFFEEYPYTLTSKINEVIKANDHLKLGQVEQFLADMPQEAVDAMKNYNKNVNKLCGKQAIFYIIADKKDFQRSDTRRDPILLAQSPFGHVWQILGAWDKEMILLESL